MELLFSYTFVRVVRQPQLRIPASRIHLKL